MSFAGLGLAVVRNAAASTALRTGPTRTLGVRNFCGSSAAFAAKDQVTHTGQAWDEEDMRSARFLGKEKQTNTEWAISLIAKVPPKVVHTRKVHCDGGGNPELGHPKVYINLDSHEPVACIYCGLRYQLQSDH